jgi:selenocysteine-specific elongation factor
VQSASRHLVLGTAGHIDHGKTSLVKALTGIDTDRLKEEKERGITIELGFAHLQLASGETVAVIDVPGHERFVRTMVAGAVGIDAVLLVVASDEGVMPQTREHLDICELLGLRGGVVALTKCDVVDGELRELGREELREALRGTFLESAPIVSCSARTGEGLDLLRKELHAALLRLSGPGRDTAGLLRLPVDRVFALRGFGTVATGTLWAGSLSVGDELVALPGPRGGSGETAKVRGLQVHGQSVSVAFAGQRAAVNLALAKESLERGDTLVRPGSITPSLLIDVELRHLEVARERLPRRSRLLFHAVSAQRLCEVTLLDKESLEPGESGLAQVSLQEPLLVMPGDRFVLRGFAPQKNHGTTVGGGQILRILSTRQRRGSAARLRDLAALQSCRTALSALRSGDAAGAALAARLETVRQGTRGASLARLRMTTPANESALRAALQAEVLAGRLVALVEKPGQPDGAAAGLEALYVSRETLDEVNAALLRTLAAHHKKDPRSPGLPRETLRSQTTVGSERNLGALPPRLYQQALCELLSRGEVVVEAEQDLLRLRGHRVQLDEGRQLLEQRLTAIYRDAGLAPPRLDELAPLLSDLGAAGREPALSAAVATLLRGGTLLRVKDLLFLRAHVDTLRQRLVEHLKAQREITPGGWKDLVGQSRKYSIPLAEYFDAEKVTLRVGDVRRLRGQ